MTGEPTTLGDRYQLGAVLGRGGMAEVRRARDNRLGRDVAVKQLRADLAGDPTFQARFRREAQSAAGLNHPTIVSVYDTGTSKDPSSDVEIPYIVMELVEGNTLRDVLREGRRILPERAFELELGVLDALSYSHKAGIIHRDIKPANVMLTRTGQVKVMDFGIARAVADTSATMTQTAAVIGTAQYLSPEQARGETVDARSDLYSAGCLLYELLTGRPPFVGDSPVSVAYQHVRETPVAPSQIGGGDEMITPAMDAIVLKSLAKSPDDRYQSAKEMRDDIARLLAGEQPLAVASPGYPDTAQDAVGTQVIPVTTAAYPATQAVPAPVAVAPAPAPVGATALDTPPPKKRGLTVLITLMILAAVAALAFGTWAYLNRAPKPTPVVVPTVVGLKQAEAEKAMRNASLQPVVVQTQGPDDDTVGEATRSDPTAGSTTTPNAKVTVTVNVGPAKVAVPNLKDMSREDAEAAVKKLGLVLSAAPATEEPVSAVAGQVLEQNPQQGESVSVGSTVNVVVATGNAVVPRVTGLTRAEAQQALVDRGFRYRTHVVDAPTAEPGKVFKQSVNDGATLAKRKTVEIWVAAERTTPPTSSEPSPTQASTTGQPTETATQPTDPATTATQPSPPSPTTTQPTASQTP